MRFVIKDEETKRKFLEELRASGIRYSLREELGYETFIGYVIEGTLEEIRAIIDTLTEDAREVLIQGYESFKESVVHAAGHLKEGESIEALLQEGYWMAEIVEQLMRNDAVEISDDGTIKLKEGVDVTSLKFQFKIPYEVIPNPESIERVAKQFAFTDLLPQYVVEIRELEVGKINAALAIAAKYFDERNVLDAYFALLSTGLIAKEITESVRNHEKLPVEALVRSFVGSAPIEINTEKGVMVVNYNARALEEVLKRLEKEGYIDIKAGKLRLVREL
ncbi:hypothetical protein [Palaeococcus ferrophilus]|uniref:hypothetical protein n=1 Tax=Palaeococcus ferrophilus TaxID=83868 RepID=UPI00064E5AB3|nr:hypothetical protein [Palaeococcus ferrophilus]